MTASERIRAARESDKSLVSALPQTPRETRKVTKNGVDITNVVENMKLDRAEINQAIADYRNLYGEHADAETAAWGE